MIVLHARKPQSNTPCIVQKIHGRIDKRIYIELGDNKGLKSNIKNIKNKGNYYVYIRPLLSPNSM